MNSSIRGFILAVICKDASKVHSGGCPIFLVNDDSEQNRVALLLARILGGVVHDLENDVFIIVRH